MDSGYVRLQAKVRNCGFELRRRLNAGLVFNAQRREAAYAAYGDI